MMYLEDFPRGATCGCGCKASTVQAIPVCHPREERVVAFFDFEKRAIVLHCPRCSKVMATVAVASRKVHLQ